MARKRELELEVLGLQLRLERATEDLERVSNDSARHAEHANTLEWSLRAANDQAKDLQEQCNKLALDKAVLMERLELVAAGIPDVPAHRPGGLPFPTKHEPEEIEDARYALDAGRINHGEFNAILEQHGFANTEIEIDGIPGHPQY